LALIDKKAQAPSKGLGDLFLVGSKAVVFVALQAALKNSLVIDQIAKRMYESEHMQSDWSTVKDPATWRERARVAILALMDTVKVL